MKFKKLAILCALLIAVGSFTISNANAAEWQIVGTVIRTGMMGDAPQIIIKDTAANLWGAPVAPAVANEILATALTAIAGGLTVVGVYDTIAAEWLDLIIMIE